ncbi:hypothetical protein E2C01_005802 [Portunus trituberculatus]|uniref:Uncharacterized protein n=1 Tax=Portunus trituberculatus TaxID=210409 RepID=A0A5B7CVZ8_PORTR|nr:hypothetical protein [Portunus trituberculatus]
MTHKHFIAILLLAGGSSVYILPEGSLNTCPVSVELLEENMWSQRKGAVNPFSTRVHFHINSAYSLRWLLSLRFWVGVSFPILKAFVMKVSEVEAKFHRRISEVREEFQGQISDLQAEFCRVNSVPEGVVVPAVSLQSNEMQDHEE